MQHAFSYILKETYEIVDSSSTACERYSVIHLLTGLANPWANQQIKLVHSTRQGVNRIYTYKET